MQVEATSREFQAMKVEMVQDATGKLVPSWMKSKLQGVKKVPNRVRRRRQNEALRRLLTPKNALSVLNEILPGEHVSTVEPTNKPAFANCHSTTTFCANLELGGQIYRGYGDNKMGARNAAAELAIRDIMLQKMRAAGSEQEDPDEAAIPMMQLASFALHKLFSEWEDAGHKVPHLRPRHVEEESEGVPAPPPFTASAPVPAPGTTKKPRELPANASELHPCMLLTYMRPQLESREVAVEGEKPQNMMFTMAVDVDGRSFFGKASNKKEARKQAARAACETIFGVQFTSI